jgi:hypothetical protein
MSGQKPGLAGYFFFKHPPGRSVLENAFQTTQVINISKKLIPK